MKSKLIVISVGGSLIVPDRIDTEFLKNFRKIILKQVAAGNKFILICGGGRTSRNYIEAAKTIDKVKSDDLDWLGIHSTKLNAHLLRTIFRRAAHPKIIYDPTEKIACRESILVAAGWKPGWSTDYDAVMLAKTYGAEKILNLSNIDYVFDRDPKKYKNAKRIEETDWRNFRKLLPDKWSPGLNSPFDPVASANAQKFKLEVAIVNGRNYRSIENYLSGGKFIGTRIK